MTAPNESAVSIRKIVLRKLSMPPLDSKASTASLPVCEEYPSNSEIQMPLTTSNQSGSPPAPARAIARSGWTRAASRAPAPAPARIVGRACTRRTARNTISTTGRRVIGPRSNSRVSTLLRSWILSRLPAGVDSPPTRANSRRASRNEGPVVHTMCRMCVNSSVPVTAEARFVVSDSGDILSPK